MNLNFSYYDAFDAGENRHAQEVMQELGITYRHATAHTIADSWCFWNCSNVPERLPPFLKKIKVSPKQFIGHGLTKEMAEKIASWEESYVNPK